MPEQRPEDAAVWARPFLRELLDHWLSAAVTDSGLFHPYLDRRWRHREDGPRTLVSQCRPTFNFSRGYGLFGVADYADAARRGLAALQTYFRRPEGGYRWAVTGAGPEADPTLDAYGHAFVILAQATAAQAFGDEMLAAEARETWRFVSETLTDTRGGLLWHLTGPDAWANDPRSQNPMMHTFEALMALHAVDTTGEALTGAGRVLTFLRELPDFRAGALVERYAPDWTPLPADRGSVVDLGHAFEWAWLLSEWHRLTGEPEALTTGQAFLRTGLAWGMDAEGGVCASATPEGQIVSGEKGLWQQCEAVRALRRYATAYAHPGATEAFGRAFAFYRKRFVDAEYGGVFAAIDVAGRPADTRKGDAWKLDYHSTGMCLELMGRAAPSP